MSTTIQNTALEPLNMSNDAISEIIRATETALSEDDSYKQLQNNGRSFKSVQAYGEPKNPLFAAVQIYYYLNPHITTKKSNMHRFYSIFEEKKDIIKTYVKIPQKKGSVMSYDIKLTNMLTQRGVMRAIFCKKKQNLFTSLFADMIIGVLKAFHEKHKESFEQTLKEKIEEYKRIQKEDQEKIDRHEKTIFYAQDIAKTFTSHIRYADHELFGDEQDELAYLHDTYYTKVDVYLVDAAYVNKLPRAKKKIRKPRKKNEIIESDTEDDEQVTDPYDIINSKKIMDETKSRYNVSYDKDYYEYTLIEKDTLESSEVMFYTIKPFKSQSKTKPKHSKWVASLSVLNVTHYKNIQNVLKTNASQTHLKNVMACKLDDIFDARNRGLSEILRAAQLEKIARIREERKKNRSQQHAHNSVDKILF